MVGTPLYCPRFIGRESELSALAGLARRAAAGETVFAFVSGDAGAGKTRLIEELRRHLPRGMRGVRGTCMEYAPSPMGSVLDIIAALEAESGAGAPLAPTGDDPVDKRRLFERVSDAVRRAAGESPFVVVLDDAQWADSVTLELLEFLIGTLHGVRVLVIAAYRTDTLSASHPLAFLVARASRSRNVRHVELEPLPAAQVHELIDATLPANVHLTAGALRDVRERSEGNPLFAEEFLKTAVDGARVGTGRTALPVSLRGLLLERLQRIGAEETRLLEVAALIGRRFDAAFLARIGDRDVAALAPFLRLAVDENLLIEDAEESGWFAFRHALTRDTILSGILTLHASALHVAIAEAIEREPDCGARVVELSDHYWSAARFAECAGHAENAGDLAKARHAYAEAAKQYERALACGIADEVRIVALHEKAAWAYASLGVPLKVIEHLDVAAASHDVSGDAEGLVENLIDLALAYRRTAQTERAFEVLRRALELSRRSGNAALVLKSTVQLAQLHALAEEWREADAYLQDAAPSIADADGRDTVRFYLSRASLRLARHDVEGWLEDSARATNAARAHGDPMQIVFALTSCGVNARRIGDFDVALSSFREAAEAGRPYGPSYITTFARLGAIDVGFLFGDVTGSHAALLDVLAELHESMTVRITVAQLGVALAVVLRDDALFSRCQSPEILEAAFSTNEPLQFASLAAATAEHHLASGDEPAAIALLERMLRSLRDGWHDPEALLPIAVCCARPEIEQARLRFAQGAGSPYVLACRDLFDAYAAARFGTREAKLRAAKAAAARFERLRMPLLQAEACELGEQPGRSVALCESARAMRPQRRLGPPPKRRSSATQLTTREREVVDLALRRLSNSAIADELSLSERTVEAHIAAAYRKLGIRTRDELLSAYSRTGS